MFFRKSRPTALWAESDRRPVLIFTVCRFEKEEKALPSATRIRQRAKSGTPTLTTLKRCYLNEELSNPKVLCPNVTLHIEKG